jgi:ornithine cyclodeaminase/alanine dehydrogenase-like protein (mu-crystallin family)
MALLISNDDVEKVLTITDCIQSIERGLDEYYRGDATCRPRIDVWAPASDSKGYYQWGSMEGTSRQYGVFATRIKSDIAYWTNGEGGFRTQEKYCQKPGKFCGLILVFSLRNAEPLAIINDGFIQHMRVGATAGIAAKHLSRQNALTVGMLGSGGMARTHAMAFCAVRTIRRVQVYSPTKENRDGYAKEMSEKLGLEVIPVTNAKDAVRDADIVAACTDSVEPVLKGEWLEPGSFVVTVKGTTELDKETLKRVNLFFTFAYEHSTASVGAGSANTTAHRISGIHQAYVAGQPEDLARIPEVRKEKLDINKLVSFKDLFTRNVSGRTDEKQIISMVGNHIQGVQFASVAGLTYQLVKEKRLGKAFPTEWLLQDIRD